MSRLAAIQDAVEVIAKAAFTTGGETLTVTHDPEAFEGLAKDKFPRAMVIFVEEDPERLDFRQQRRRVTGTVGIGMVDKTREQMDQRIEDIRDLLFADDDLTASVDYIAAEAGTTFSSPDDPKRVYGQLDITTEEVF